MDDVNARKLPLHLHARAALFTVLSTLVPVPFADDWLLERARRDLVASLLKRHERRSPVEDFAPLYEDKTHWLALPFVLAGKLLLVPVRALVRSATVVLAVRGVTLAVAHTLELGRTLDRLFARGTFSDDDTPQERERQAMVAREAFEEAFKATDVRLLSHALSKALMFARQQGIRFGVVRKPDEAAMQRAIDDVAGALHAPEVQGFYAELDRRFDEGFAERMARRR